MERFGVVGGGKHGGCSWRAFLESLGVVVGLSNWVKN